ncbi:MAG: peptidylprolyl isomerase [Sphingomonas hengshuiensis]|uniref:peptidylprolyl isomerase n=2 Tax=Sphingomonas TaxID=13687 RepID=A0A2W4ZFR9_9SPHN|nr:MAG: peptidylprolyl isomerase [Sphingomonas hengshuiensis]
MAMRPALLAALALAGPVPAQVPAAQPAAEPPLPRVAIVTTAGTLTVEVETKRAPITAANFLRYVDQKRLDGVSFYRVVKVAPEFGFVQFGPHTDVKRMLPPIRHEPTTQTGLSHTDGTLSVARLAVGTARGEFTISVGDQRRALDAAPGVPADGQGYAAFARVVAGRDVLSRILETPVDPARFSNGAFKGEMPAAPVRVVTARRVEG